MRERTSASKTQRRREIDLESTSLNYAKLKSRASVIHKLPSPKPAGSLRHPCLASWLSALPWPWIVPSLSQTRSLQYHHPQPGTSSQEQESTIPSLSSSGTLLSLASGRWEARPF